MNMYHLIGCCSAKINEQSMNQQPNYERELKSHQKYTVTEHEALIVKERKASILYSTEVKFQLLP